MTKLSFKDYYESKKSLLGQSDATVIFRTKHDVYKYCKVPFSLNENKVYVSFKPKDVLIVEWQRTGNNIKPLRFEINGQEYYPSWNEAKMKSWVEQTTTQLFEAV